MPIEPAILVDLFHSFAGLALFSILYGVIGRRVPAGAPQRVALGLSFGAASLLALTQPIMLAPGVLIDMRHLPIAFAGAFAGPGPLAIALGMGATARLAIGGEGAIAGVAGMAIAGLAGLCWARLQADRRGGALARLALLGAMVCAHLVAALLLPIELALDFLRRFAPAMAALNLLGTLVVGGAIERERALALSERDLRRSASRDALTGVLNRRGFHQLVEAAQAREVPQEGGALMILDLDHFKRVNDEFGHAAGDSILVETGRRLQRELRATDVLARFGGEEFVVFVPSVGRERAGAVAQRLCQSIGERPFEAQGQGIPVTVSVGVRWFDEEEVVNLEEALGEADAHLYEAKTHGRNRVVLAPGAGGEPAAHLASALPAARAQGPRARPGGEVVARAA